MGIGPSLFGSARQGALISGFTVFCFFMRLHIVGRDSFILPLTLSNCFTINLFSFQQSDEPMTKVTEDVTADKAGISSND
jgi:hypothetical protein